MFRKLISISFILLLCFHSVYAVEIPNHTKEFYVNDFAEVLSEETENMIVSSGKRMFEKDGSQIVVATVKSLDGADIESYALSMAREYRIGSEDKDNGMLILLATDDREVRIEVGNGLEGIFNDAKVGRFLDDYAISYFAENDFDYGVNNLYRAILIELGLENTEPPETEDDSSPGAVFWTVVVILAVIYIIAGVRGRSGYGGGYYGGGFGGGYGGGFSGGGSSGGGGGFSGGGASRKF